MPAFRFEIDLLIFDLDGTVADTRRDLTEAANHVRRAFGRVELSVGTVTGYVGDGVERLLERALPGTSEAERREARRLFDAYYEAHVCDHTYAYPGMEEVLRHFSRKQRALLTNKAEPFVLPLLEALRLRSHFDVILGARAGLRKKPAPDAVLHLLEQLRIPPGRALLVGDSPQDLQAGRAARVHTCAVTYGFRPAGELRALHPDLLIDHPLALKQHVA